MIWLLEGAEKLREEELTPFLPLLDAPRRERITGFRFERSRTEAIAAWLLLRCAFDAEYGGAFPQTAADERGKPAFTGRGLPGFSLSHSLGAVACALSGQSAGVDVQARVRWDAKYRRVLSAPELAWVEQTDSDARFTALWTRKEAYGKQLGVGIGYALSQTDFSGDFSQPKRIGERLLWTAPTETGFLSACTAEPPVLRTLTPDALLRLCNALS